MTLPVFKSVGFDVAGQEDTYTMKLVSSDTQIHYKLSLSDDLAFS